jgi:hypothetical protein
MYTCGNKGGNFFHIPSQLIRDKKEFHIATSQLMHIRCIHAKIKGGKFPYNNITINGGRRRNI